MISRIARFYKVSFEQFKGDWVDTFEEGDEDIQAIYDSIRLPERALLPGHLLLSLVRP